MDLAIGIDDAVARILVHARGADLVPAAFEIGRPALDLIGRQRRDRADTEPLQLFADDLLGADDGAAIDRPHAPVELDAVETEGVAIEAKRDPAHGVRRLLRLALDDEAGDEAVRLEEL